MHTEIKLEKVVIFGASGHAKVIIDILEQTGDFNILGLLDSNKKEGSEILGYKILGGTGHVSELINKYPGLKFFVAIGDNWSRSNIVDELQRISPTIEFVNAIHPDSIIGKNVTLGKGIMIMAGAIINADSVIGDFTIVNTRSSVGHESVLKKFSSLAPNCTLAGNVDIGEFAAISISATVLNGRKIGKHTVIGAGSLLTKDADAFAVYYGIPSKFVRLREKGNKYL